MPDALPPPTGYNLVDLVFAALICFGLMHGYARRLSGEIARTIALVVVFLAGVQLFPPVDRYLAETSRLSPEGAHTAAFVATLIIACLIMWAVRLLISRILEFTFTTSFDRWGGAVAGGIRMTVIGIVCMAFMMLIPHPYLNEVFGRSSAVGRTISRYLPDAREALDGLRVPASDKNRDAPEAEDLPPALG